MPIKSCKIKGKKGKKFGNNGKCYTGKGAESKAKKQQRAIYSSGWKGR